MKKKIFMFLLSLFFILPGTVLLTACGDEPPNTPRFSLSHDYDTGICLTKIGLYHKRVCVLYSKNIDKIRDFKD